MESIYYVMCWACHRRCVHCYDDRFRPYVRDKLEGVITEGEQAFAKIIANLPERLRYRRRASDGSLSEEKIGRIILAGGEPLLDGVRERILYPALDLLREKYGKDGAKIVVQTTGDKVTPDIVGELVARGVFSITCAGMDEFHVGMEADKRPPLLAQIEAAMAAHGVERVSLSARGRNWLDEDGPFYNLMGADPNSWIGELWPRGRAWDNDLSQADMETNFCARHSGAKDFLSGGVDHSEVAIEPNGNLYPCCLKTSRPIGNVAEEPLEEILDSLRGHPVFEALNQGRPDLMGESLGVSAGQMAELSKTQTPKGRAYQNLCVGCDKVFEHHLAPILAELAEKRRAKRAAAAE